MQCEVFLTSVTIHLMTHYLEDFRITSNRAYGEELHYDTPIINDDNPTDKQVVSVCFMRRMAFAANETGLAPRGMLLK